MAYQNLLHGETKIKNFNDVGENEKPEDLIDDLINGQVHEITQAINILTALEDLHFNKPETLPLCSEEAKRVGGLIEEATTKLILTKRELENIEKMIKNISTQVPA